jgi:uncharacterized repeat protein (TIGR01451 family)
VASIPLLLLSMLVISIQDWSVAQAVSSEVTVGSCTGNQDFATIQAAVNDAVTGTVINICPGTYSESVNLSLMNSIGDITLRRAPGQTDSVLISPAISPSVWITRAQVFSGSITLESINVSAATNTGIDFGTSIFLPPTFYEGGTIQGNLVISNVKALANGSSGAFVHVLGNTWVVNSEFSNNPAIGLYIISDQNADIINTQANNNGDIASPGGSGTGIQLENNNLLQQCSVEATATTHHVNLNGVTANANNGWGVYLYSSADVTISATQVISNAYDGLYASAEEHCGPETPDLAITNSIAQDNGWFSLPTSTEDLIVAAYDEGGGFRLLSDGTVTVSDHVQAFGNQGFGFCIYSNGDTTVHDALAENNAGEGFLYNQTCSYYGRASTGETEDVAQAPEFNAQIAILPSVVITNSSAISNGGAGFGFYDPYTSITLTQISATENLTGVAFAASEFMLEPRGSGATVNDVDANGAAPSPATAIDNSLIQGNATGVYYGQPLQPTILDADIIITSTNSVNNSIICENNTGLNAEQFDRILIGSLDLPTFGFVLDVDARGNWWGSATGPTTPDNPGGTGDSIESTALDTPTNTVQVLFAPWIDTIDDSIAPDPTLAGVPVNVSYQFRDSASSYFLENGVGDPNNGPLFTLNTSNGAINGDNQKFIVNNLIEGSATPSAPGLMVILLSGPCGLSSTQNVFVATPSIHVDKSPDAQGVAAGSSAIFTVTVYNSGSITLTDISVSDTAVPSCSRSTGALGDLGVGASTSYTCPLANVANNMVNTVNVQGFALVDGSAAGSAVTDSDTANVYVASATLTKTVYVNGYNEVIGPNAFNPSDCALNSTITVPVSTTVKYCYTLTNTGDYTLTTHSLVDNRFPTAILNYFPQEVGPGESFSTVDAGVEVTKTLTLSTTNVATWTAEIAAPVVGSVGPAAVNAVIPVVITANATVTISPDDLDQDNDGIPDNKEGSGDINTNGIPDFLDPATPTNEPPTQQPGQPGTLYLPSLGNNE